MADRSQAPMAGRLLRGLTAFQGSVQAGPFTIGSIADKANDMADIASRSFGIPCNTALLTHFNHCFPLPQQQFWRLVPLMPERISLVILTLEGKRLLLQQWMTASKPKIGNLGSNSVATPAVTPTCSTVPSQSNSNYSSVLLQGPARLLRPRSSSPSSNS
jgi:hypothetical protein